MMKSLEIMDNEYFPFCANAIPTVRECVDRFLVANRILQVL